MTTRALYATIKIRIYKSDIKIRKEVTPLKRLTCILITFCLLMPLFHALAYAEENSVLPANDSTEYQPTLDDIAAGIITPYEYYGELDPETVPEIIGYETAKSRLHVRRMYDEEDDLNTIVFMNADTTRTKYYFGHPVKYVDENGVTKDISLNIVSAPQSANAYMTEANSVTSAFSRTLSDGVSLSNGNVSVTLVPTLNNADSASSVYALRNNAQAQLIDNKTVSYYYDEKTTIEYKLTYTGFKEDIIVSEYTGKTEYDFTLYTNGLYLTCIDGSYYLLDDNDTVRATLGDIIIFTADERNNTMGCMSSVTVREGYEYELTIHVDADFLADERTVYPIRIDPTVEVTDGDSIGAMEDVLIRQNYTYTGSFGSSYIGRFTDGTLSRLLVRFPYLNFNTLGTNSTFITSATVELRDLMCSGVEDMYIDCHIYNISSPSWSESSGATWTSVGNSYVGTLLDSHLVSYGKGNVSTDYNRYSFDITEAAKMWANGTQSPQKGLVFKASSSFENQTGSNIQYWRKTFASYNRAEYKPSFTLTFTKTDSSQILSNDTYYINNLQEGKYIKRNGAYALGESGLLANLGTSIQFRVEKADVGYIIKSASGPTQLLSGVQSMPYVNFVVPSSADIPTTAKWDISYSAETGVLIKNLANNCYLFYTSSGLQVSSLPPQNNANYPLFCWRAIKTSVYGNTSAYMHRELGSSFSISDLRVDILQKLSPTINKQYTSVAWANSGDFRYSYDSDLFTYNANEGSFTGVSRGPSITVIATHKVTNYTKTFKITVNANLTSFLTNLANLYDVAYEYENENKDLALETVFNFVRGQKYNNSYWPGIVGAWDQTFISLIQDDYPELYQYFIRDFEGNEEYDENYLIMLPDSSDDHIDIIHMFATLNRLYYSGNTTFAGVNTLGLLNNQVDDLSGWAGDFQALIRDYYDAGNNHSSYEDIYNSFYPMIGNDTYFCSYTDIISDMDACNLYALLSASNITTGTQLSSIIRGYYTGTSGTVAQKRFTSWIGDLSEAELNDKISVYCDDRSVVFVKWPILDEYNINDTHQDAFTDAFTDFLISNKNNE